MTMTILSTNASTAPPDWAKKLARVQDLYRAMYAWIMNMDARGHARRALQRARRARLTDVARLRQAPLVPLPRLFLL
jgi:hypothetical protein